MNKNIYILICLILGSLNLAQAQEKMIIDKVVAKVGGETILHSEIETQFLYASQQFGVVEENMRCQIIESIIDQKIIVNQAKLDSIVVLNEEVEERLNLKIDNVLRQMNGDETFFQEYYGATPNEMKDKLRDDERQAMLAERMQVNLISSINVTPSEVVEFYNKIPVDSLPYLTSEVEISEIVYEPKVNETQRQLAKDKADDLYQQLLDGGDFASLAKIHSDDPGSGAQGGNLGFAKRGLYVPEFEAVAYSLKKNEISEPVETQFGFHIIQMLERRGNNINLRHILITPEITFDDLELAKSTLDSIKTEIQEEKIPFEIAVKRWSSDNSQGKNYGGRLRNPATGNTFFETKDLPTDIYFEIDELEIGDIAGPVEYTSERGETLYRIIKLDSRTEPHRANLKEDYAKITEFAKENKKAEFFYNWIQKRKTETFIEVSNNYESCPNIQGYIN